MAFINFINTGGGGEAYSALNETFIEVIDRSVSGITLPDGLTTVGENAFASCHNLTDVTVPASVTSIEANAFAENRSLETITFEGTTPPTVDTDAFSQLPNDVTINVPDGSEDAYSAITEDIENSTAYIVEYTDFSGDTTVWYSKYSSITYSDNTNVQPTAPYGGWAKIETKGVIHIGDNAMINEAAAEYIFDENMKIWGCTPIRGNNWVEGAAYLPQKVVFKSTSFDFFDGRIAEQATNLSSITFYCQEAPLYAVSGTPITTADTAVVGELIVPEGAHNYGIYKKYICGDGWTIKNLSGQTMGTITIEDIDSIEQDYSYNTLPGGAFSGRSDIVEVTISSGLTYGGGYTFQACTNLTTAVIYGELPSNTFRDCTGLLNATFEEGVTKISLSAFADCSSMTSVNLPSTLTGISSYAFLRCQNLASIRCDATTAPNVSSGAFNGVASTGTLYVPTGSDYSTWMSALPSGWTISNI